MTSPTGASLEFGDAKTWESEWGELWLGAMNVTGERVTIEIFMCWPPTYEDERCLQLDVRPEGLARLAENMRDLLRLKHGSRFVRRCSGQA